MYPGNIFRSRTSLSILYETKKNVMVRCEDITTINSNICSTSNIYPEHVILLLENTDKKIRDVVSKKGFDMNSSGDRQILAKNIWKILINEKLWLAGLDEDDYRHMKKLA
jgi:hypothetical protein